MGPSVGLKDSFSFWKAGDLSAVGRVGHRSHLLFPLNSQLRSLVVVSPPFLIIAIIRPMRYFCGFTSFVRHLCPSSRRT